MGDLRTGLSALLLGSGGWIPTSRRETCCAYLRDGDQVLLIDAGTGVQRLVEQPELLDGVVALDIVLTHFHLDHVAGLSYLPALGIRPSLWAPGKRLAGTPAPEVLGRLFGSPLFAAELDQLVTVQEVPATSFGIGPFELSTRIQRLHTDPTLALRLGDLLTYCTDTAADRENADFARGSSLLLHEAWYAAASTEDETHSAAGDAGRIARTAGVDQLVLIHVNPTQPSDAELARPARAEFPGASVGEDLVPLPVS